MNRNARSIATTAKRPNRILIVLAALWMAAAIAIGGFFTGQQAEVSASQATSGAVGGAQP